MACGALLVVVAVDILVSMCMFAHVVILFYFSSSVKVTPPQRHKMFSLYPLTQFSPYIIHWCTSKHVPQLLHGAVGGHTSSFLFLPLPPRHKAVSSRCKVST
uniref:Uncharacterized protein n=1 Tax=Trypanosoma congolense (strain IL3000) TaxID=1068625 RepID=G0USG5_TRYCI|nr:hypothetical protein, unlikely [Trypanosoma congolense IL3000]